MKLLYRKNKQNMKKLFVISLFFFVLSNTLGQQRKIDSLKRKIVNANTPEDSLKIYKSLFKLMHKYEPSGKNFSEYRKGMQLVDKLEDYKFKSVIYRYLSTESKNNENWDQAFNYVVKAYIIDSKHKNEEGQLLDLNLIGSYYIDNAKYKEAIHFLNMALKHNTKKQYPDIALVYGNIGIALSFQAKYDEAIKYFIKSLSYAEKTNDSYNINFANYQLGVLFMNIGEYNKAEEKLLKIEQDTTKENIRWKIGATDALGFLYWTMKKYKKAIYFSSKAEEYYKARGNIFHTFTSQTYQVQAYNYLGEYDKAIAKGEQALKISQKIKNKNLVQALKLTLSTSYLFTNNYKKALKYLDEVSAYINKNNADRINLQRLNKNYAILFEKKGKYAKSVKYYKKTLSLTEKAYQHKLKTKAAEIETKYQTAKKEKENALLKKQKAEQELEIAKRKRQNLIYASGLGASLLSLGIFLFFYRKNLKQKRMILNLQRELHHRIKNNLRVITAFISSIKEKFENKEKVDVKEVNYQLNELEKRVQTIYNLHKQLYEGAKVTHLDLDKYINLLTQTIASNYDQAVEMELDIPEGTSIKADNSIILGLILTELTINAFKHAFRKAGGKIRIKIKDLGKQLQIVFSDNGPGLPEDLDINNLDSFGMRIVRNMTKQMDGELKMKNENGLTYEIVIPKK